MLFWNRRNIVCRFANFQTLLLRWLIEAACKSNHIFRVRDITVSIVDCAWKRSVPWSKGAELVHIITTSLMFHTPFASLRNIQFTSKLYMSVAQYEIIHRYCCCDAVTVTNPIPIPRALLLKKTGIDTWRMIKKNPSELCWQLSLLC